MVLSGVLLVVVLVSGWMLFVDGAFVRIPVVYDRHQFPVNQKVYLPGETVLARVEAYKSLDLVGSVQWSLVDHQIRYYKARNLPLPRGVVDAWFPIETIPECASGTYHFEGIVSYRVNPLRVVTYKVRTDDFEIINNKRGVH